VAERSSALQIYLIIIIIIISPALVEILSPQKKVTTRLINILACFSVDFAGINTVLTKPNNALM